MRALKDAACVSFMIGSLLLMPSWPALFFLTGSMLLLVANGREK